MEFSVVSLSHRGSLAKRKSGWGWEKNPASATDEKPRSRTQIATPQLYLNRYNWRAGRYTRRTYCSKVNPDPTL